MWEHTCWLMDLQMTHLDLENSLTHRIFLDAVDLRRFQKGRLSHNR